MKLPNFLIVGAPKCGTTTMTHALRNHPEVYMPQDKAKSMASKLEPHYFIKPKEKMGMGPGGFNWKGHLDKLEDYENLFAGVKAEKAIGEASAGYLFWHDLVIPQVKQLIGDPKIIIMLRDPVARAYSSYLHKVRLGIERESFRWCIENEEKRAVQEGLYYGCRYRGIGEYSEQIRAYQRNFSNVHVIIMEDLATRPDSVYAEVKDFLELEQPIRYQTSGVKNAGYAPRIRILSKIIFRIRARYGSNQAIKYFLKSIEKLNSHYPQINPKDARYFAISVKDDIEQLSKLLDRDMSFWINKYI